MLGQVNQNQPNTGCANPASQHLKPYRVRVAWALPCWARVQGLGVQVGIDLATGAVNGPKVKVHLNRISSRAATWLPAVVSEFSTPRLFTSYHLQLIQIREDSKRAFHHLSTAPFTGFESSRGAPKWTEFTLYSNIPGRKTLVHKSFGGQLLWYCTNFLFWGLVIYL